MGDSNANPSPRYPPLAETREEQLVRMQQHLVEVKKQYPELDVEQATQQFMKPSLNLGYDLKEQVDGETYEKVNEAVKKMFDTNAGPHVIKEVKAELEELLSGHENILKQINDMIFANEESVIKIQEYARQEAADGSHPFPALAPKAP